MDRESILLMNIDFCPSLSSPPPVRHDTREEEEEEEKEAVFGTVFRIPSAAGVCSRASALNCHAGTTEFGKLTNVLPRKIVR